MYEVNKVGVIWGVTYKDQEVSVRLQPDVMMRLSVFPSNLQEVP